MKSVARREAHQRGGRRQAEFDDAQATDQAQVAARRVAADDDLLWPITGLQQRLIGRDHIIARRRIGMLRGQAIVQRADVEGRTLGQAGADLRWYPARPS